MTSAVIPWDTRDTFREPLRTWTWELDRSALVLLDFQVAYADPARGMGPLLRERHPAVFTTYYERLSQVVIPNAVKLVELFHQRGAPVVFTRLGTYLADGQDLPGSSWRVAAARGGSATPQLYQIGTSEQALIPELEVTPDDLVIDRPTLSIFNSTTVQQSLINMNVKHLVLGGLLAEGAPETTARAAGERGFGVIFVEDAAASLNEEVYQDLLQYLAWSVPRTTADVLALYSQATA